MPQIEILQIGEIAKRAGVSVRTVRYYEERGLLPPAARTSGGVRLYGEAEVARLCVIRRLRTLGLSLDEIEGLLGGRNTIEGRSERVTHTLQVLLLEQKRAVEQLAAITQLKQEIDEAIASVRVCSTCDADECPDTCSRRRYLL